MWAESVREADPARGRSARWRRCIKLFELSFVPLTLLLLVKVKKTAAYECAVSFRLKLL